MKCYRCKKTEDARTRLGGLCHDCMRTAAFVHPVIRALARTVAW